MDLGHPQHSLAGVDGQLRNASTYGDTKLPTARVCLTFRSRNTMMSDREYASAFDMSDLWDRLQGFDRDD
ncbi:hypothetical protein F2Q70_00027255 [Brassica cretica]|uniref:Uncharacterized protein n=1 Tax=Brassica cretica TaxID=69181 RepID=A0A8S9L717_BRACR|nr:hypothetical protein F2Q70_00027255 [Brassica cretica]